MSSVPSDADVERQRQQLILNRSERASCLASHFLRETGVKEDIATNLLAGKGLKSLGKGRPLNFILLLPPLQIVNAELERINLMPGKAVRKIALGQLAASHILPWGWQLSEEVWKQERTWRMKSTDVGGAAADDDEKLEDALKTQRLMTADGRMITFYPFLTAAGPHAPEYRLYGNEIEPYDEENKKFYEITLGKFFVQQPIKVVHISHLLRAKEWPANIPKPVEERITLERLALIAGDMHSVHEMSEAALVSLVSATLRVGDRDALSALRTHVIQPLLLVGGKDKRPASEMSSATSTTSTLVVVEHDDESDAEQKSSKRRLLDALLDEFPVAAAAALVLRDFERAQTELLALSEHLEARDRAEPSDTSIAALLRLVNPLRRVFLTSEKLSMLMVASGVGIYLQLAAEPLLNEAGDAYCIVFTPLGELDGFTRQEVVLTPRGMLVTVPPPRAPATLLTATQVEHELEARLTAEQADQLVKSIGLQFTLTQRADAPANLLVAFNRVWPTEDALATRHVAVRLAATDFHDLPAHAASLLSETLRKRTPAWQLVTTLKRHVAETRTLASLVDRDVLALLLRAGLGDTREVSIVVTLLRTDGGEPRKRVYRTNQVGAEAFETHRITDEDAEVATREALFAALMPWQLFTTSKPADAPAVSALDWWTSPDYGRVWTLTFTDDMNHDINGQRIVVSFPSKMWPPPPTATTTTPSTSTAAGTATPPIVTPVTSSSSAPLSAEPTAPPPRAASERATGVAVLPANANAVIAYPPLPKSLLSDEELRETTMPLASVTGAISRAVLEARYPSLLAKEAALASAPLLKRRALDVVAAIAANVAVLAQAERLRFSNVIKAVVAMVATMRAVDHEERVFVYQLPIGGSGAPSVYDLKRLATASRFADDVRNIRRLYFVWGVGPTQPAFPAALHARTPPENEMIIDTALIKDNFGAFRSKFRPAAAAAADVEIVEASGGTFPFLALDYSGDFEAQVRDDARKVFSSLQHFLEASRFAGFPAEIDRIRAVTSEGGAEDDDDYEFALARNMLDAVVHSEERLTAAGVPGTIRVGYHRGELRKAIYERVTQFPAYVDNLRRLPLATRFVHMPRVVIRRNAFLGIDEYSIDEVFGELFTSTMTDVIKRVRFIVPKPLPPPKPIPSVAVVVAAAEDDEDNSASNAKNARADDTVALVSALNQQGATKSSESPSAPTPSAGTVVATAAAAATTTKRLTVFQALTTLIEEPVRIDISDHARVHVGSEFRDRRDEDDTKSVFAPFLHIGWPFVGSRDLPAMKRTFQLVRHLYPELMPRTSVDNFNAIINIEARAYQEQLINERKTTAGGQPTPYAIARQQRKAEEKRLGLEEGRGVRTALESEVDAEVNNALAEWRRQRFEAVGVEDVSPFTLLAKQLGAAAGAGSSEEEAAEAAAAATEEEEEEKAERAARKAAKEKEEAEVEEDVDVNEIYALQSRTDEYYLEQPEFADCDFIFESVHYETLAQAIANLVRPASGALYGDNVSTRDKLFPSRDDDDEAALTNSDVLLLERVAAMFADYGKTFKQTAALDKQGNRIEQPPAALEVLVEPATLRRLTSMQRARILQNPGLYRSTQRMFDAVKRRSMQYKIDYQRSAGIKGLGAKHEMFAGIRGLLGGYNANVRAITKANKETAAAYNAVQAENVATVAAYESAWKKEPENAKIIRAYKKAVKAIKDKHDTEVAIAEGAENDPPPAPEYPTEPRPPSLPASALKTLPPMPALLPLPPKPVFAPALLELQPLFDACETRDDAYTGAFVSGLSKALPVAVTADGKPAVSLTAARVRFGATAGLVGGINKKNVEFVAKFVRLASVAPLFDALLSLEALQSAVETDAGGGVGDATKMMALDRPVWRTRALEQVARLLAQHEFIVGEATAKTAIDEAAKRLADKFAAVNVDAVALGAAGVLIGTIIGHDFGDQQQQHSYLVRGIEMASNARFEDVVRLVQFAEHIVEHTEFSSGAGSQPLAVYVDLAGLGAPQSKSRLLVLEAFERLGYRHTRLDAAGTGGVSISTYAISIDEIHGERHARRPRVGVHSAAMTPYARTLAGEWLESSTAITKAYWNRRHAFESRSRYVGVTDAGEAIRLWTPAPLPHFLHQENPKSMGGRFRSLTVGKSIETTTFFSVRCVMVGARGNGAGFIEHKVVYQSNYAPSWVKMKDRVMLLPHQTRWRTQTMLNSDQIEEGFATVEGRQMLVNRQLDMIKHLITAVNDELGLLETQGRLESDKADEVREKKAEFVAARVELEDLLAKRWNNTAWRLQKSGALDWEEERYAKWHDDFAQFDDAIVSFDGPRFVDAAASNTLKQTVTVTSTLKELRTKWAEFKNWPSPESLNRPSDPVMPAGAFDNERLQTLLTVDAERWTDLMRKYRAPMPWTRLESMLVLATHYTDDEPAPFVKGGASLTPDFSDLVGAPETYEFQVFEHTFVGHTELKPRIVFRSRNATIEQLMSRGLPDTLLRGAPGTDLRTVLLRKNVMINEDDDDDDDFRVAVGKSVVREQPPQKIVTEVIYEVECPTLNAVNSLTIVFDASVNKHGDDVPKRLVVGAFYIDAKPSATPVAIVTVNDREALQEQRRRDAERDAAKQREVEEFDRRIEEAQRRHEQEAKEKSKQRLQKRSGGDDDDELPATETPAALLPPPPAATATKKSRKSAQPKKRPIIPTSKEDEDAADE